MRFILFFLGLSFINLTNAQTNTYSISFENAVHHEAHIQASFPNITADTLIVQMSRTSPGRYALHEFAKNVYGFNAKDSNGSVLAVTRPDPYSWAISGHDGTINLEYTLFANRGDGTYSQIDETHAHLNIPATFMFAPSLSERKITVDFKVRKDLDWNIATQLPKVDGTTYMAPNLHYFMDSPTEISNFKIREFLLDGQTVRLALHDPGSQQEADAYFEKVKKAVLAVKEVFGELPNFDYGTYTFLACYVPNTSGDGMEHRNSTILTSTRTLANGGMDQNIGTVSHEFFHSWNVERIRPESLEPFDFEEANMSGELWFAEGFTSYYTNLILCRAGLITPEEYVEGLNGTFNYVWNSPARRFFNPIEMSFQAPFVDAATSVDPVNRENTFISYYSYGSALGLALDLALREKGLTLDDYMKQVWLEHGKTELPYTIENLNAALNTYAGETFGNSFFDSYIYKSDMPNYEGLLKNVGITISQNSKIPLFGAKISIAEDLKGEITTNTLIGSPAYKSGLEKGDIILSMNGTPFAAEVTFEDYLEKHFTPNDTLTVRFERFGEERSTDLVLGTETTYKLGMVEKSGQQPSKKTLKARKEWLKTE